MRLVYSIPAIVASICLCAAPANSQTTWNINDFQNLVTFGDSYTDENRLNYVTQNNGTYPPPGIHFPESFSTAGGGRTWPRYVVQYAGSTVNNEWRPQLELYDYAVSGAVCSNLITPRNLSLSSGRAVLFPSVLEYEIPTYTADLGTNINMTSQQQSFFNTTPTANNTVHALWIGTNDLGVNAFLTDSQAAGATLSTFTSCTFRAFDALFATGARSFVLINTIPLDLAPLYANTSLQGTTATNAGYWATKPDNLTDISERMREYTTSVNEVWKYQLPFQAVINTTRYPGAKWALFDVHSLFRDVYANPAQYLNGTNGTNIQGWINNCSGPACATGDVMESGVRDGFLWYDQLHPSEQMDRVVARNFVNVINGNSSYATYYG